VTIPEFDKRLLIEQIRYIEAKQKLDCDDAAEFSDPGEHLEFEQRLWKRAQCIVQQHGLASLLLRADRLSRYIRSFTLLIAALLGAAGASYAVSSETINIYWLLLVLLGFNLFSVLLWLAGISLNMKTLTSGVLARLVGSLSARLSGLLPGRPGNKQQGNKKPDEISVGRQADHAWLACNFSGDVGKWQLSKITHQLWLAYLLAGLILLVLLLMVRQYDFVWGTTLLSDSVFIKLTDYLSVPLDALGFVTPSAEQVLDTRIVATQDGLPQSTIATALTAEHRNHWAQFLLGALLCFGILPRILLWGLSALMYTRSRRRFALDLYLPYYINLRQRLMPMASHGQVVDADTSPPDRLATTAEKNGLMPVPHTLPEETRWVAVELGDNFNWPPQSIDAGNNLGQVVDRESQSRIELSLQSFRRPLVAVAVAAARAPDRGVKRTIASLLSNSRQRWLVLLEHPDDEHLSSKRMAAWYRLAEACDVPADHVISMQLV
jgi:hypothetical protein